MGKEGPRLILASQSPQRRQLLQKHGFDIEVMAPQLQEENLNLKEGIEKAIIDLALDKAKSLAHLEPEALILGSDTVIFFNGQIFGKARSREEAYAMLEALSGKEHSVWTGVALWHGSRQRAYTFAEESKIRFKVLTSEHIHRYLDLEEWRGRAGAYAIQEKGRELVEAIQGSYENVVGLPIDRVASLLKRIKEEDDGRK